MHEDLAEFRAAYPTAAAALAACPRADWAILLTYEVAADRKHVLWIGAELADALAENKVFDVLRFLLPWLRPLEAVEGWSASSSTLDVTEVRARSFPISAVVTAPLIYLANRVVIAKHLEGNAAGFVVLGMYVAMAYAIHAILGSIFVARLRRAVAELDEPSALALVIARLQRNAARCSPMRVHHTLGLFRRRLERQLPR